MNMQQFDEDDEEGCVVDVSNMSSVSVWITTASNNNFYKHKDLYCLG